MSIDWLPIADEDRPVQPGPPAPRPSDAEALDAFSRVVVEVSDTSLRRDRDIKLPIYARAGVAEAWIVDVRGERILVYRSPRGRGYESIRESGRDGVVSPAAFPDLRLAVDDVFR